MAHIDTAEMYGSGGAEEIIAEALRGRRRAEVFLASKVLPPNASHAGTIAAAASAACGASAPTTSTSTCCTGRAAADRARPCEAMEELVARRQDRASSASATSTCTSCARPWRRSTRERLACNQVLYNLGERGIEHDLIPFCARAGIAVVGYTPFGGWPGRGRTACACSPTSPRAPAKRRARSRLRF